MGLVFILSFLAFFWVLATIPLLARSKSWNSIGKSTLLNHLFGTKFVEMDACRGRSQTTKGIWIAECSGMQTSTIAMDQEGTDRRERGEDDTAFKKQSALLALATANVVLINMWCHDIGREHAANKPLLKNNFSDSIGAFGAYFNGRYSEGVTEVAKPETHTSTPLSEFFNVEFAALSSYEEKGSSLKSRWCHDIGREHAANKPLLNIIFQTPLEHLEPILMEDIQKVIMFAGVAEVAKPETHTSTPLSEFFNVEFAALSSYEEKEVQFTEQVDQLRLQISSSISPGSLLGDGEGFVPASGFCFSVQQIWKTIKENKNLDLPAHKVIVATVCCEEISNEKLKLFASDEDWVSMEKEIQAGPVSGC